ADDVLVHALPLYRQHGLGGLHTALFGGSTVHIRSKFSADDLVRAAGQTRASVLFAVPTIYQALALIFHAAEVCALTTQRAVPGLVFRCWCMLAARLSGRWPGFHGPQGLLPWSQG